MGRDAAYKGFIEASAKKYNILPQVLYNLIQAESGFNPNARSPVGALGIAQFMPATAKGMGINPMNPQQAIDGAAKYIHNGLAHYKGDYSKALAAYNAGFGAVDKYKGIPPYKETQNYVKKILGNVDWKTPVKPINMPQNAFTPQVPMQMPVQPMVQPQPMPMQPKQPEQQMTQSLIDGQWFTPQQWDNFKVLAEANKPQNIKPSIPTILSALISKGAQQ